MRQGIELLFFAYRDFTAEPDAILEQYGFGRAHHRVVHFVGRHPQMTVGELLGILRITKQSLNRVLGQLVRQGFIIQHRGAQDRRQRLLELTESGRELERRLSEPQRARVARRLPQGRRRRRSRASARCCSASSPSEDDRRRFDRGAADEALTARHAVYCAWRIVAAMSETEPHLLVVDDDARLRELLRRYLSDNGFRVTAAADAGEARANLASFAFDLIVLDVMMPGESGLDLTRALRAEPKRRACRSCC